MRSNSCRYIKLPCEKKSLENLAAYLTRATFSQERMDYSPHEATVVYRSKDGKEKKTYDALEWLAAEEEDYSQLPASPLGLLNHPGERTAYLLSHPSVQFLDVRPGLPVSSI